MHKIVNHLKNNKKTYITGGVCLVVTAADLERWRTPTVEPHVACAGCTDEAVSAGAPS